MPGILARLILAMSLLIVCVVVYILMFVALDRTMNDYDALGVAAVIAGAIMMAGWCLVWHGTFRWTPKRLVQTVIAAAVALVGATTAGIIMASVTYADEGGIILGAMLWTALWMGGTAIVWRESSAERSRRLQQMGISTIACPNCGYNLTGLKQSICPECGTQYTLDQLFLAVSEDRQDLPH